MGLVLIEFDCFGGLGGYGVLLDTVVFGFLWVGLIRFWMVFCSWGGWLVWLWTLGL